MNFQSSLESILEWSFLGSYAVLGLLRSFSFLLLGDNKGLHPFVKEALELPDKILIFGEIAALRSDLYDIL